MDAEQFYAASLEVQRAQLAVMYRVADALEAMQEHALTPHPGAVYEPAQLELAAHTNGHAPASPPAAKPEPFEFRSRLDAFGQELPRGISWDPSGEVWQVDVTPQGRSRRRVRIPSARFAPRPDLGLAEACRVRAVLRGESVKANLAALHPDTARDVAAATSR